MAHDRAESDRIKKWQPGQPGNHGTHVFYIHKTINHKRDIIWVARVHS